MFDIVEKRETERKKTRLRLVEKRNACCCCCFRAFSLREEKTARETASRKTRALHVARIGRRMHLFARFARFRRRKPVASLVVFRCFHHRRRRSTRLPERQKYAKRRRRRKSARGKNERKALTRRQFPRPPRPRSRRLVPRLSWSVVERTFWLFSIRKGVKDLSRFRAREKWRLFFVLKSAVFFQRSEGKSRVTFL